MRICLVHNDYAQPSGEEVAVSRQAALLEGAGHEVDVFSRSSANLVKRPLALALTFFSSLSSRSSRQAFAEYLQLRNPDLVHIHNIYPLISPSVLEEAHARGYPIVATQHNYRRLCPVGTLFSNGSTCRACVDGTPLNCALRSCAGSVGKSTAYALRHSLHRRSRVLDRTISMNIALTEFQARLLKDHGVPSECITVVGNYIEPQPVAAGPSGERFVAYVGRLSPEKGVSTLLGAARLQRSFDFKLVGDGRDRVALESAATGNVHFEGFASGARALDIISRASCVVIPSLWYEGFPMVLLESWATGTPVIVSDVGALRELVEDRATGLVFPPGDSSRLAACIEEVMTDQSLAGRLSAGGLEVSREEHGPERHYERLMSVYSRVLT